MTLPEMLSYTCTFATAFAAVLAASPAGPEPEGWSTIHPLWRRWRPLSVGAPTTPVGFRA
jgi:hypothetical protein